MKPIPVQRRDSNSRSGKIVARFKSHILTKKATKRKRNLTKVVLVDKSDVKNIKLQLCA